MSHDGVFACSERFACRRWRKPVAWEIDMCPDALSLRLTRTGAEDSFRCHRTILP